MKDFTDFTSTSFGLLIAYLLPGLTGLLSLMFWLDKVREIFDSFLKAETNIGLFILVILAALVMGLLLDMIRTIVFENWRKRLVKRLECWPITKRWFKEKSMWLEESDIAQLQTEAKLPVFRAVIDETYRYHQFWGGMSFALLLLYSSWIISSCADLSDRFIGLSVGFLVVEVFTVYAAIDQYQNFVTYAQNILGKEK